MIEISGERAVELLEIVTERMGKDYVYDSGEGTSCFYAQKKDGEIVPSCGVGHALVEAGVPVEWFFSAEHRASGVDVNNMTVRTLEPFLEGDELVKFSTTARNVFSAFQTTQDFKQPWGSALLKARMMFNRFQ